MTLARDRADCKRLMAVGLLWLAIVWRIAPAQADVHLQAADGINVIIVSDEIKKGDHDEFNRIAAELTSPAFVILNSRGGNLMEGLVIGEAIHAKGYPTAVLSGTICASACSLIWLAGTPRYAGDMAYIGFHAAYTGTGDAAKESGSANAIVGAYLAKLNLSYKAILFATSAPPDRIAWLQTGEAARIGIQYEALPNDPDPTPAATVATAGKAGSLVEQRMKSFVSSYYADWSGIAADATGLSRYYNQTVTFYGANLPLSKLMSEKQKFAQRWPTRQFTVRPNTVFVQCTEICAVTGVVEWDVRSLERGVRSIGAANFVLKIMPVNGSSGGIIVSENGSVLANHLEPLASAPLASTPAAAVSLPDRAASLPSEQQVASTTPAYAQGRQARINYEQWFAALLDGPYKEGAAYWAEHRSVKPVPSCAEAGLMLEWQAGCAAGKALLTVADQRRKTEKDYWWGWNSL